jgi:uncharacterized protein (TIGR03084 family)
MHAICKDLKDEYDTLDQIVAGLDEKGWNLATPFYNWSIKDEISHLAYYDTAALQSLKSREAFMAGFEALLGSMKPGDDLFDEINTRGRMVPTSDLLATWRATRQEILEKLPRKDPRERLAWYGPDMSARSFATARIMEIWAHGQDIIDTLGLRRMPTHRLKHIAHMGVATYGWSFINRQMPPPEADIHVVLAGPSDQTWVWGPEGAPEAIIGDAQEFCLVITQRRNIADTSLQVKGDAARQWMAIAQAFAGPAADPPLPGERVLGLTSAMSYDL